MTINSIIFQQIIRFKTGPLKTQFAKIILSTPLTNINRDLFLNNPNLVYIIK